MALEAEVEAASEEVAEEPLEVVTTAMVRVESLMPLAAAADLEVNLAATAAVAVAVAVGMRLKVSSMTRPRLKQSCAPRQASCQGPIRWMMSSVRHRHLPMSSLWPMLVGAALLDGRPRLKVAALSAAPSGTLTLLCKDCRPMPRPKVSSLGLIRATRQQSRCRQGTPSR